MSLWNFDKSCRVEPFRVLLKRGEFVDSARESRLVPYKIYYPVDHGLDKIPIILWSHGFGGNRDGASFISRFLAGQGYVIVHITHIGTDSSLWEGKKGHPWDILKEVKISRETTLNRMYDVPFVLDELERWIIENPYIGQYMDINNIGMSGHSFGAMTTQVMAGMKFPNMDGELISLRDKRISSGILYSPVPIDHLSDALPEDIYGSIDIPLFHMTGSKDDSPIEGYDYKHRLIIKDYAGNSEQYLQVLDGGDHMIYNGTRGKLANNPKREEHEELILEGVFAFWQSYLKGDDNAMKWLKNQYS